MLAIGGATRVYLAVGATDMRKSFEGLSGMVREKLNADPHSGHWFVFCNKSRTRLKVLIWDGSGLWVCAKRLERGTFSWPKAGTGKDGNANALRLSQEELALLLGGIDLTKTERKSWWRLKGKES